MLNFKLKLYFFCFIITAVFFLSACSTLTGKLSDKSLKVKGPEGLYEVQKLLLFLQNRNIKLKTFKGIGKITFWKNGKKGIITSAAWVGSKPDKLRIAIRNVSGQPIVTFASDGSWLYFVSHTEQRYYKKRSNKSNLKKFISIPIKSCDVFSILAGRVPVYKHDSESIIKNDAEDGYTLVLKKKWGNVIEKIYVDSSKNNVRKVEVFNDSGSFLYSAVFDRMQTINGFDVPLRLIFLGGNGNKFQLNIQRYWADIPVLPSVFVLNAKRSECDSSNN
ncbi:MAG: DUF4292 domain-containing protein [Deltaproteobacteria bacterium]|nr:DUF4292 domain-containing protein [Deltaproteobacteria bacterium]MBW2662018.1 DUF4292 domain-containing protein [Deltaproteobacteria bacterium]